MAKKKKLMQRIEDFSKIKRNAFFGKDEEGNNKPIIKTLVDINTGICFLAVLVLLLLCLFISGLMPVLALLAIGVAGYGIASLFDSNAYKNTNEFKIADKLARAECFAYETLLAPARVVCKGIAKCKDAISKLKAKLQEKKEKNLEKKKEKANKKQKEQVENINENILDKEEVIEKQDEVLTNSSVVKVELQNENQDISNDEIDFSDEDLNGKFDEDLSGLVDEDEQSM